MVLACLCHNQQNLIRDKANPNHRLQTNRGLRAFLKECERIWLGRSG